MRESDRDKKGGELTLQLSSAGFTREGPRKVTRNPALPPKDS